MYPQGELNRLAAYRVALRRDIARRRVQCAQDAARVSRPLIWADRVHAFYRKLRPFAAMALAPVTAALVRMVFPGQKMLGTLVRWSPLVLGAVSGLSRKRPSP